MAKKFVRASFDLDCEWEGLPPIYRIYVNGELFTERTWIWVDHYLSEMLQILGEPGRYRVDIEPVRPHLAKFSVANPRIEYGPGQWLGTTDIEIMP